MINSYIIKAGCGVYCFLALFVFFGCQSSDSGGGSSAPPPNADDLTGYQWHLKNTGQSAFASETGTAGEDINQTSTYNSGIKGSGVVVAVVDSGLEIAHSDLDARVVPGGSWDFWNLDSDPTNNYDNDGDHGTSVAGIIAAEDNGIGGRGVAPGASLKGFNFINSNQTAVEHADALGDSSSSPKSNDVDIFNMSYGYNLLDDEVIDTLIEDQLSDGVTSLRGGKGAIYVKSAGNGFVDYHKNGVYADCDNANTAGISCQNVNMDPISATPWVINVGALNADGKRSSYSTGGSGIWISAPGGEYGYDETYGWSSSNTKYFQPAIVTTDQSGCTKGYSDTNDHGANRMEDNSNGKNDSCNFTSTFNGTSSAAPVVSGAVALLLEANPNLSWRDVKHILATTARKVDVSHDGITVTSLSNGDYDANLGWVTNDASPDNYSFHNWYGFGAVDVDAAVAMADSYLSNWGSVPDTTEDSINLNASIPDNDANGRTSIITITDNLTIEVVEVTISITHPYTGDIGIELTSPGSTKSILFTIRNGFGASDNLSGMVLISNAFYGETSNGGWTLKVVDGASEDVGTLDSWKLKIYGH